MADNTQILTNSTNTLNTNKSEHNNTIVNGSAANSDNIQAESGEKSNTTVVTGGNSDTSSVYLMQMLNFIKSGQLKVKIQ
jgi:hypothetical protein